MLYMYVCPTACYHVLYHVIEGVQGRGGGVEVGGLDMYVET